MTIEEISTPALLIERSRLEANLSRMQDLANRESVELRPHTKTHRCVSIARRQHELGATGITVAKVGEAEVYAAAGFDDIRIAYEVVGRSTYERIASLQHRARISVCVDTPEGANMLSEWFHGTGHEIDVLVEVDTGYGRCGVRWDASDSVAFVKHVAALPGLNWRGLLTHAGNAYHGPANADESYHDALVRHANEERDRMLDFAVALRDSDLVAEVISIGSTPTMSRFRNTERGSFRITEIRPGNYVFNDAIQVGLETTPLENCALTVLATVISRHRDRSGVERIYLDAGKKVVTADTGSATEGYGILLYNPRMMTPLPHAKIVALSEEHGWVEVKGGSTLQVGDRARFVPNHACVAVDTRDEMVLVDGDDVVEILSVDARGKSS